MWPEVPAEKCSGCGRGIVIRTPARKFHPCSSSFIFPYSIDSHPKIIQLPTFILLPCMVHFLVLDRKRLQTRTRRTLRYCKNRGVELLGLSNEPISVRIGNERDELNLEKVFWSAHFQFYCLLLAQFQCLPLFSSEVRAAHLGWHCVEFYFVSMSILCV